MIISYLTPEGAYEYILKDSSLKIVNFAQWDNSYYINKELNLKILALADTAQWIEHWPANQRVASSIPSQGKCLGCRPGLQ